jgi:hypothetical protein
VKVTAYRMEYQIVVSGHNGSDDEDVDATVLTSGCMIHGEPNPHPTVISFSGKVGFTIDQLECIASDLRTLEDQQ